MSQKKVGNQKSRKFLKEFVIRKNALSLKFA